MGGANLVVQPGDVFFRVVPVEADGGPARRLAFVRRVGAAMPWNIPFHVQDRAAGLGLITGLPQEGQELLAGNVVFAERKGLNGDLMLGALRVKTPSLGVRAAHDEGPGRDSDHHRALGTFLKLTV